MDREFLFLLDELRAKCGFPFHVNSGYRTKEHNQKIKGKTRSAHLKGRAADIRARNGRQRFLIIRFAMELGFKRIGVARSFIHLDNDGTLPQEVIFLYTD